MGLFNFWERRKKNMEVLVNDGDDSSDEKIRITYLKRFALDVCANFVARAVGQSEFKIDHKIWYYKLNVRPNTDMSAAQFWEQVVYKLILDNRVLVILTDSNELLIADSWVRNEYAVYEDTFEGVTVKGYTFLRTFKMSDVFYLEYNNQKLSRYTEELFRDYGELYARLVEAAKRNNQIRGTVSVEANKGMDDETRNILQGYIDKLFMAFKNRSIAIAPLVKGFSYEEHSNKAGLSSITVDEIEKIPLNLINNVADAIGIPTALLHGDRAELKDNMKAFNQYCLAAMLKKIEDELNAKIISQKDYMAGKRVEVSGINRPDIFELAEPIDKLISSGTFNTNEIRDELGYEPREGGDEYCITKNLEKEKEKKEDKKE